MFGSIRQGGTMNLHDIGANYKRLTGHLTINEDEI